MAVAEPLGSRKAKFKKLSKEAGKMMEGELPRLLGVALVTAILTGCSGGSLTTREKGAGIGALGGAAAGGIIGATVGHPGAGAAIGGALGLGAGALIGDYMQGQEQEQYQANQQQIQQNQRTIERNSQQIQKSRQTEY